MPSFVLRRSDFAPFLKPVLLYVAGCASALVVAQALGEAWLLPLFLSGMVVILLSWRKIRWPDAWSRYLSFGAVLLLMCAFNRAFFVADYFVNGVQFDQWPFWVASPQTAVFKGEVIAILGTLLTVFAWRLCGGMQVSPAAVLERPRQTFRVMLTIYAISMVGLFVSERIPRIAAMFGQLLPTLLGLGLVGAFLLPMARLRRDWARLVAVIILSAPFAIMASGTGSKQNIILAAIPSAVMTWRFFRNPLLRMGLILAGLTGLALTTAYVNLYRAEVWIPESRGLAVSHDVKQDFMDEVKGAGLPRTVADGLSAFIKRADGSYAHGWAVSIADEQAFHPQLVFTPLVYVFVPRILWPGKPSIQQGWEYSGLVFGQRYISWSQSSTAAGFYPALYLGAGWPAVMLGSLLAGALLAGTMRLAHRFGGNLTAGLYIFSMLPFMLHMNENWTVGGLSGPIVALLYVLAIVTLARVIARVTFSPRHARAHSA